MMTKYILHGGNTRENNQDNNGFYKEMAAGLSGEVKILLNYFARSEREIEVLSQQDVYKFKTNNPNRILNFIIASLENFAQELLNCDVLYMRGGSTELLLDGLSKTKNIRELFNGKVISGSSAGAYALCKYYFGNDSRKVGEGLGILDLKTYCHFDEQKDKDVVSAIKNYKEDLPILVLPNYKWQVFYK